VTFQIRFPKTIAKPTKYFAISCCNEKVAHDVASNIYSLDGISHIYINKCGRFKHDTKVISADLTNYEKEIYN
jgi:hypothetical protein